jgi:hypothetical protein
MRIRPPQTLRPVILLLAAAGTVQAADYIGIGDIPETILAANIERLASFVAREEGGKDGKGGEVQFEVTRLLGNEDLGQGKQRVWFCIKSVRDGTPKSACGGDIRLIRLDSGRWIIQDIKRDAWQVVQQ